MGFAQKTERIRNPPARTGFASALVLAAGLALMPGCNRSEQSMPTRSPVSSVQKGPEKSYRASDLKDQRDLLQKITGITREYRLEGFDPSKLHVSTERQTVAVGDEVRGGLFENTTVPFRVTRIDDTRVEIGDGLAFEYGKPRTIGESLLMTTVRAEKGSRGLAVISVTTCLELSLTVK
jgi:hypothetical protein